MLPKRHHSSGRRLLKVMVPEQLYFRLKQAVMLNRRPISQYVVIGIRYVLNHMGEITNWPPEYFKTLENKADFLAHDKQYG
jgi:hypothetical protein